MASQVDSWGEALKRGVAAGWPICLGYLPIGMALGVLAEKSGLDPLRMGLMSVLVFAGSAQFIGVAMLEGGASPLSIIVTTFVVNFRHFLMSSALAVPLAGVDKRFLSLFAYGVTDESFGVNMTRYREGGWSHRAALVVHHVANTTWIIATVAGAVVGTLIPKGAFGIDYALAGMFIALLVMQLHGRIYIVTGVIAGVVAVMWRVFIPGDSYIVGAAVVAATIGFYLRRRSRGVCHKAEALEDGCR
ncbi:MAG: branched-chain amino acid ABC transporter permease [Deltaproteobacteria bacterium]|nr:MAG: branched-chain amino acid ABC transporter permease [Deltaproteobacteria bacterium]